MINAEILEKLTGIFRDIFDDETISIEKDTQSKDIQGWDSLTHITLISAIEAEFKIEFEMKEIIKLNNVGELIEIIESKV